MDACADGWMDGRNGWMDWMERCLGAVMQCAGVDGRMDGGDGMEFMVCWRGGDGMVGQIASCVCRVMHPRSPLP
eukprot:237114-Chlamydomonas_euryale.AAC.1